MVNYRYDLHLVAQRNTDYLVSHTITCSEDVERLLRGQRPG